MPELYCDKEFNVSDHRQSQEELLAAQVREEQSRIERMVPQVYDLLKDPEPGTRRYSVTGTFADPYILKAHYFKGEDIYKAAGIEESTIPVAILNTTYCHIVTNIGQVFEGKSICMDRRTYDWEKSRSWAFNNAYSKLSKYLIDRMRENQFLDAAEQLRT